MNKYLSNKYLFISLLTISLLCIGCTDNDETGPKSVSTLPIVDDEGGIYGQPLDQEEKPLKTKDGIYIKVVVTNPQTPVYKATDANIVESTLNYFDILYVHAKETVGDTNWYNVSFSANLNTEIGWISSENCTEWNHRVGFRPKSEKAGINTIYFYSTAEEAKMALEGESIEPVGVFDILPDKKFPYHPWIILDKKTFSSSDSQEKTVAYKVLCLGKKGETLKTATKGYTVEERANIKKSVQSVDISFVIDGTGSMSSSIKAVKTAVSKMVHTFNECQVKVLFSLTVYRDICDGKERMLEYHQLSSMDDFLAYLDSIDAKEGGDRKERGYPALETTFQRTNYRPSSTRLLILVGDAPFHTTGDNNPDKLNNEDIIALAKKNQTTVYIMDVDESEDLGKQVGNIAVSTNGNVYNLNTCEKLQAEVVKILGSEAKTVDDSLTVIDSIVKTREIDPEKIAASTGKQPEEITHVIRILTAKGVDLERLQAGDAITVSGWITPHVGNVNLGSLEVYFFYSEAKLCLNTMQELLRICPDTDFIPHIITVAEGERLQSATSVGAFLTENSIPFGKGSILKYSIEELKRMPESQRARLQDELLPLIRKLDENMKNTSRWERSSGVVLRGWIPEDSLP